MLYEKLAEYGHSDYYPLHMPGHKRQPLTQILERTASLDITEIDGFDNLHQAEGILQKLQDHAAMVYGSDEAYFLVNGSTGGILSAMSAALPEGGHILMARNCHKSAYHGAYLRNLKVTYLFPELEEIYGIYKALSPLQVEQALAEDRSIQAVLIVSPTYEGIVPDIAAIADVVHRHGIPLIVDAAHGSHLGFHPAWPQNSSRLGADMVIQSLHKTLPSLTQTALLTVNGERTDRKRLRRFLGIYQSSSPSYVLLAAMEEAVTLMEKDGEKLCGRMLLYWNEMLETLKDCKYVHLVTDKDTKQTHDIGKLVISLQKAGMPGQELYDILLNRYHLQLEMAAGPYALAMYTVADSREGYHRLAEALLEIDAGIAEKKGRYIDERDTEAHISGTKQAILPNIPQKALELWEAWDQEKEQIELEKAEGRIAGEFLNLYPPGTPLVVPGEQLEQQMIECIRTYIRQKLPVQGVSQKDNAVYVTVLK